MVRSVAVELQSHPNSKPALIQYEKGGLYSMSSDVITMYLTYASLFVAVASLLAGIAAAWIAKATLTEARQVAERERRDWAQRKWFDLYFAFSEACDVYEGFQIKVGDKRPSDWETDERREWNRLMLHFRKVFAMASVFPKTDVITYLLSGALVFDSQEDALTKKRLDLVLGALERLRLESLIDSGVLLPAK